MQFHTGEKVLLRFRDTGKPARERAVFVKEEPYRLRLIDGEELAMCVVRMRDTEITVQCSSISPDLHLVR